MVPYMFAVMNIFSSSRNGNRADFQQNKPCRHPIFIRARHPLIVPLQIRERPIRRESMKLLRANEN